MEIIGTIYENSKTVFMEDFFKLYHIIELYFVGICQNLHAGGGKFVTEH